MVQQISNLLLLLLLFAIISSAEKPVFVGIIKITSLPGTQNLLNRFPQNSWQEKIIIFYGNRHHITFGLGLGWG